MTFKGDEKAFTWARKDEPLYSGRWVLIDGEAFFFGFPRVGLEKVDFMQNSFNAKIIFKKYQGKKKCFIYVLVDEFRFETNKLLINKKKLYCLKKCVKCRQCVKYYEKMSKFNWNRRYRE